MDKVNTAQGAEPGSSDTEKSELNVNQFARSVDPLNTEFESIESAERTAYEKLKAPINLTLGLRQNRAQKGSQLIKAVLKRCQPPIGSTGQIGVSEQQISIGDRSENIGTDQNIVVVQNIAERQNRAAYKADVSRVSGIPADKVETEFW